MMHLREQMVVHREGAWLTRQIIRLAREAGLYSDRQVARRPIPKHTSLPKRFLATTSCGLTADPSRSGRVFSNTSLFPFRNQAF